MHQFIQTLPQQIVNGLDLGSIYALIAIGYTLVYGVLRLINFAHGDVFMVGAFVGLAMGERLGQPLWVALVVAMAACAVLGMAIERLAYRPLRKAPRLATLITAIGVSLLLENGGQLLPYPGPNPRAYHWQNSAGQVIRFLPLRTYAIHSIHFHGIFIPLPNVQVQLASIAVWIATVIIVILLRFLVMKTKVGRAMRAVQHDQDAAALMGINVNGIILFTFALGSALAALAGVLYGIKIGAADPLIGLWLGLKAFVAAVLGGIGSIQGAILGGLLLGVVETAVTAVPGGADYHDGIAFLVLILVLLWRPTGLLGTGAVEKV